LGERGKPTGKRSSGVGAIGTLLILAVERRGIGMFVATSGVCVIFLTNIFTCYVAIKTVTTYNIHS
jgi:hypothetical protein